MINEIPIYDYVRVNNDINNVNNLDIKNNNFTVFLQMYEQVNNSRDIISFELLTCSYICKYNMKSPFGISRSFTELILLFIRQ